MKEKINEIEDYWNKRSGGFSEAIREELLTEPGEKWQSIFREYLPDGCQVLDDGAGAGFFTVLLSSMGFQTTAVDYSAGMLEQISRNLTEQDLKAELLKMDVQKLDFPDGSFDAVVSRNVFWNLEEPEEAYREIARVLRPGGTLILEDGNYYLHFHHPSYRKAYEDFRKAHPDSEKMDCHARHNPENVDFSIMDEIAKELPLSKEIRPAWDFSHLVLLGFHDIRVKISPGELPLHFLIIARKGDTVC